MRVGQSDADDERRRWSDAFQIDYVEVQNLAEEFHVRSEATLPQTAADNDLRPSRCGSFGLNVPPIKRTPRTLKNSGVMRRPRRRSLRSPPVRSTVCHRYPAMASKDLA